MIIRKFHVLKMRVTGANGENTVKLQFIIAATSWLLEMTEDVSVTVVNSEKKTNVRPSSQDFSFSYRIEGV